MGVINKVQERYRESNKKLYFLGLFFSLIAIYFALHVIYISVTGLMGSHSDEVPLILQMGIYIFLSLTFAVELLQAILLKRKKYIFMFVFVLLIFMLMMYSLLWMYNN
ncbi:hypothetical protein [Halalkalibacillus halophilus]|uniref:hypothetical protein n=1 Tax=Halalkalibacillus halophilus TaxID=392827 RepID=UPI00048479E2|nr:hypothetical protein [Halalkalibacillus halophilus]